jgi:dephospho-CoA kinase
MLLVGVTGGIGSGKSTFVALLVERGAQVIDADEIARDALRPDRPAWHSLVDQFGEEVLAPHSMEVDRAKLAEIVFNDEHKLAALNAIVHPVVFAGIADDLEKIKDTDEIVALDAALIVETGLDSAVDLLIAVVAGPEIRRERLMAARDLSPPQINARMRSQVSPEELEAKADIVVRNHGTLEDLAREADRVWAQLKAAAKPK